MHSGWTTLLQDKTEWLATPGAALTPALAEVMARLTTVPDRAALVELLLGPGTTPLQFWRRDYLVQLVECGLVNEADPLALLLDCAARFPRRYRHAVSPVLQSWIPPPAAVLGGTVLLISAFGIQKFGGAEHFLEQMARLYRDLGFDPLIVGARTERQGERGLQDGLRYAFVAPTPAALFRLAWEEQAVIAHVVSGLGNEVAAALRFLDTRLIFGVHFWREMFYPTTPNLGYYPNCPAGHTPRPEFQMLLVDYDAVYANSDFSRDLVVEHFGVQLPVIPSLPDDPKGPPPADADRRFVLLANSRFDKGYYLLLELAKRLPDIPFLVTATQSGIEAAKASRAAAGVENVTLRGHCDEMGALYAAATAVLVPSYHFVETFSRVVIEAQRHGVPVIGSDAGNVPVLLRDSGVSLPERAELWVAEIRRLFDSPTYWQTRSAAALRNAARHSFGQQSLRLQQLVEGMSSRFLLGVGSGIGNIIHTTPLIRRIAQHLGRKIDVIVAGDSSAALAIVANSKYVGQAYNLTDIPVHRHYDTVYLTHSFGTLMPPFRASRLIRSRSWDSFHAGHPYHEAEFNLASAQALLGIPYQAEDIAAAFVADLRRESCEPDLIGLHAGSKTGAWSAKRWPHFVELAARLQAHGLRVASFGGPDEHVQGTLDRTGGSVEEMAKGMLDCRAFLSNDSGCMNIANALNIPLLAIFGPTEVRTRGPLGPDSRTVALHKPCAPCELAGHTGPFFQRHCHCIGEIHLDDVEQALLDLLNTTAVAAAAEGFAGARAQPNIVR